MNDGLRRGQNNFNRTFNSATDDPMSVVRWRQANPIFGGAQEYDPAEVGQPEPDTQPGAVWTRMGRGAAALKAKGTEAANAAATLATHSDDRAANVARAKSAASVTAAVGDQTSTSTNPTTPVAPVTKLSLADINAGNQELAESTLRSAHPLGRNLAFMGDKDATQYSIANRATGGVVTRAPGADGLRKTTYLSGAPSAADAARDAQFARAGYGKDAYGNWMTPQRIADQQKLAGLRSQGAVAGPMAGYRPPPVSTEMSQDQRKMLEIALRPHAGAQNGQLTANQMKVAADVISDHNAGVNNQRRLGLDYAKMNADSAAQSASAQRAEEAAAAANSREDRRFSLDVAKYQHDLRKTDNLQSNSERDADFKAYEGFTKQVDDILRAKATKDGKFDGEHYAQLKEYAGNFKSDYKAGSEGYLKDLMTKLAVDSEFLKDEGGFFRPVRAQGSDPVQDLRHQQGMLWGNYLQDPVSEKRISYSQMKNLSPSAQRDLLSRIGDEKLRADLIKELGLKAQ